MKLDPKNLVRGLGFVLPCATFTWDTVDKDTPRLTVENAGDSAFAISVLAAHGAKPLSTAGEIAAFNSITFTWEKSHEIAASEDHVAADPTEGADSDDDGGDALLRHSPGIDGAGRKLRSIRTAEDLKMAEKIFTNTLGNLDDKSSYAAFLYDLDNFFSMYRNDSAEEASFAPAGLTLETLAELSELAAEFDLLETAKKGKKKKGKAKSGRSQFLKPMMRLLSSGAGEKLIAAWMASDPAAINAAIDALKEPLAATVPDKAKGKPVVEAEAASEDEESTTAANPDSDAEDEDDEEEDEDEQKKHASTPGEDEPEDEARNASKSQPSSDVTPPAKKNKKETTDGAV